MSKENPNEIWWRARTPKVVVKKAMTRAFKDKVFKGAGSNRKPSRNQLVTWLLEQYGKGVEA